MEKEKIDLVLLKKESGGYYFSNPKIESESEVFNSKLHGFKILIQEFWHKELITNKKTIQLIDELAELTDLQISFISTTEKGISQLENDLSTLAAMKEGRDLIFEIAKFEDGPIIERCGCGRHLRIEGKNFMARSLSSKKEAREMLKLFMNEKIISDLEHKKLLEEINALNFPEE